MIDRLELVGADGSAARLLHAMQVIRAVETALADAYLEGRFGGPLHVSLGQEGAAVGIAAAMGPEDVFVSNHRGHGHALAVGLEPMRVVAEIVGDPCGFSGGVGGSMHVLSPEDRFLGTNGIVGDGAGLAVGAALALQLEGRGGAAVAVVGDGAMATGIVAESLNLAHLWRLPVLFVCENNQYAELTPTDVHLSTGPADRASGFGFPTFRARGEDVESVMGAADEGLQLARSGQPAFVEVVTHRWGGHYVGDPMHYRPEGEDDLWRERYSPIERLARSLGREEEASREYAELLGAARALVDEVLSHEHRGAA